MVLGSCFTRPLASFARLENHPSMFFCGTCIFKCCVTLPTNLASNNHHFSGSGMQVWLDWVPCSGAYEAAVKVATELCGGHGASLEAWEDREGSDAKPTGAVGRVCRLWLQSGARPPLAASLLSRGPPALACRCARPTWTLYKPAGGISSECAGKIASPVTLRDRGSESSLPLPCSGCREGGEHQQVGVWGSSESVPCKKTEPFCTPTLSFHTPHGRA